jgi:hypothetical protein
MLRCFFPINFNFNFRYLFKTKKHNDIVAKKENPNIYKKLFDKNRNTYLNLAKQNMDWFNNKMEKNYGKKRLKTSLFLCGNEISIIEPPINETQITHVTNNVQESNCDIVSVKSNKNYNKNCGMLYGPIFLKYTLNSLCGVTSIMISIGLLYYLIR